MTIRLLRDLKKKRVLFGVVGVERKDHVRKMSWLWGLRAGLTTEYVFLALLGSHLCEGSR